MITVAWIGLGRMGSRMARRVLDAGHDVWLWNRTAGRAAPLCEAGARLAATPADAVRRAQVVVLMLADPEAVRSVTTGLVETVRPGTTVVDMSTVGPDAVARLRTALPDEVVLLDAPVLGSVAEAEAGTLTLLVGGPPDAVARARPLLSVLGRPLHVGPLGAGAAAKLVANSALIGILGVLGEAVALADRLGLPREVTWRVLELTPMAAQASRRRPMVDSGTYPARFRLALARKDAGLVVDGPGADLRLARAALTWLADAEAAGLGGAELHRGPGPHPGRGARRPDMTGAVVFDLDGTLLDTMASTPIAYADTIRALGGPGLAPEEIVAAWHIGPTPVLLAHFLGHTVSAADLESFYRRVEAITVVPFPGVVPMLDGLRRDGYRLGVYTSATRRSAAHLLGAAGLADRFGTVVCGDEVERSKPAPDGLLIACRNLRVTTAEAAYVGDLEVDMDCAIAAGALGIRALWSVPTPAMRPEDVGLLLREHRPADTDAI